MTEIKPVAWMDDGSLRAGSDRTAYRVVTEAQRDDMPKSVAASFSTPLYSPEAMAEIERLRETADHWKEVARGAGVCMTCRGPDGWPEPYGCTDCLNTGWSSEYHNELGETRARAERLREDNAILDGHVKAAIEDYNDAKQENERLRKALDIRIGDLVMLRCAINENDPKNELLLRVDDMLRETRAALQDRADG